jgi:cyclophilin family peptidyl-prolyl cis-trans isomerase
VFLDVSVGGEPAGRIVLGVYGNDTPKTAANFVALGRCSDSHVCYVLLYMCNVYAMCICHMCVYC